MKLAERFWTALTHLLNVLTLSPIDYEASVQQIPLLAEYHYKDSLYHQPGPVFVPPGYDESDDFKCYYTVMTGWTKCPIAPNKTFVYRWNTTQYGSSWYHSHYSVQYPDGLLGPMVSHCQNDYHQVLISLN